MELKAMKRSLIDFERLSEIVNDLGDNLLGEFSRDYTIDLLIPEILKCIGYDTANVKEALKQYNGYLTWKLKPNEETTIGVLAVAYSRELKGYSIDSKMIAELENLGVKVMLAINGKAIKVFVAPFSNTDGYELELSDDESLAVLCKWNFNINQITDWFGREEMVNFSKIGDAEKTIEALIEHIKAEFDSDKAQLMLVKIQTALESFGDDETLSGQITQLRITEARLSEQAKMIAKLAKAVEDESTYKDKVILDLKNNHSNGNRELIAEVARELFVELNKSLGESAEQYCSEEDDCEDGGSEDLESAFNFGNEPEEETEETFEETSEETEETSEETEETSEDFEESLIAQIVNEESTEEESDDSFDEEDSEEEVEQFMNTVDITDTDTEIFDDKIVDEEPEEKISYGEYYCTTKNVHEFNYNEELVLKIKGLSYSDVYFELEGDSVLNTAVQCIMALRSINGNSNDISVLRQMGDYFREDGIGADIPLSGKLKLNVSKNAEILNAMFDIAERFGLDSNNMGLILKVDRSEEPPVVPELEEENSKISKLTPLNYEEVESSLESEFETKTIKNPVGNLVLNATSMGIMNSKIREIKQLNFCGTEINLVGVESRSILKKIIWELCEKHDFSNEDIMNISRKIVGTENKIVSTDSSEVTANCDSFIWKDITYYTSEVTTAQFIMTAPVIKSALRMKSEISYLAEVDTGWANSKLENNVSDVDTNFSLNRIALWLTD